MDCSPSRTTVLSDQGARPPDPCQRWVEDAALMRDLGAVLQAAVGPVPPAVLAASRALLGSAEPS